MRVALVLVLLAAACVSVNKSVLMDRSMYPVAKESVYVFLEGDEIPADCERVAILNASGDEDFTNEGQMIDKMREETGKLGGNALLLRGIQDPGTEERVLSAIFGTNADRDAQGLALWCPSRVPSPTERPDTAGTPS